MAANGNVTNDTILDEIKRVLDSVPVKHGWFRYVIPIITFLGLIGNLLNVLVLTRRRMISSMERSATYGAYCSCLE